MTPLTFKFPNRKTAELFMEWLDGQGEQDYSVYADAQDERGNLEVSFKYDYRNLVVDCKLVSRGD